ncbi:uncharacterized protein LOC113357413 isoform X1 [Papaver somniferum]|uniref:uncharacterized protein LOC113357413 isoform X1 n=1 Tax=Papaver somniferum TaxID=3469 RepID=UPI000E700EA3|nr:uncharacterized protein LOC113357413 isoform X1 [Papaver somniferum]XP_026456577.1 uncharacterized protein LOC113357413 isoform X1 [Papaver somniferum]
MEHNNEGNLSFGEKHYDISLQICASPVGSRSSVSGKDLTVLGSSYEGPYSELGTHSDHPLQIRTSSAGCRSSINGNDLSPVRNSSGDRPSGFNGARADFPLIIPTSPVGPRSSISGKDLPPFPNSSKSSRQNSGGFCHDLSSKNKVASLNGEGGSRLGKKSREVCQSLVLESVNISVFPSKKSTSLPVTPLASLTPSASTTSKERIGGQYESSHTVVIPPKVPRSLSVPVRNVVIVRSLSFINRTEPVQIETSNDITSPIVMEDGDQEIPEEEAVCRICFVELTEGGKTFKMECSCKGDLRLTHEECVVKWFSIKGNKTCDVCRHDVRNLPVAVLRVHASRQRIYRNRRNTAQNPPAISAWYDLIVLTMISSISYFFFLEQLLRSDMKSQAIVIAAPFAFSLGLLGSMFAIIVAIKEYVWTYTALEFVLVVMILHLCYTELHLHPIYAVLLSAIVGFGTAISVNALCLYICMRRPWYVRRPIDTWSDA